MKLLFDENISFRVVKSLKTQFPEGRQVKELGLENTSDKRIWDYAKHEQFTIVTFDADFYDFVTLYGHPPKIIWLRMGNTSTRDLIHTFQKHFDIIKTFLTDNNYKDIGCLEIDE